MPRVLHLTDSHLMEREPAQPPREFGDAVHLLTGRTTNEATASICAAAKAVEPPIDLVIHTGDIADEPSMGSYEAARALMRDLGAPVLVTPGNHDDPTMVAQVFGDGVAPSTQSIDLGGWRIILASSWDGGRQSGTFTDDTLEQLHGLLDIDGPVLVATHHPPLTPCSHPDCINDRGAEFLSIIDSHENVIGVIAGHLHLADEIHRRGVRHLVSPSSALQLRHVHPLEENNAEPTPAGARLLDLDPDGSMRTELIWA